MWNRRVVFLSVCAVSAVVLVVAFGQLGYGCVKLTKREQIPDSVYQKLLDTEMERGVYMFTHNYTGDAMYVAVCGGEAYINGYDVDITDFDDGGTDAWNRRFKVRLKEYATSEQPSYSVDFKYPFMLFRIKQREYPVGDRLDIRHGLSLVKWWGHDAVTGRGKGFEYEVVRDREEIPDTVWSTIEGLKFSQNRRAYVFDPKLFDTDDIYMVMCPGDKSPEYYDVLFENIQLQQLTQRVCFEISLREDCDARRMPYSEGFEYPFVVLKISISDQFKGMMPTASVYVIGSQADRNYAIGVMTDRAIPLR